MRADAVIVDYGMGNLRSVSKAVQRLGFTAAISNKPEDIRRATRLILPGVGAFSKAMTALRKLGLVEPLRAHIISGKPFLGICLGLQLLFEGSEEGKRVKGLGVFPGRVKRFRKAPKVPHMGWNQVRFASVASRQCPLLRGIQDGTYFYFVHSYYPQTPQKGLACLTTHYGEPFVSMIWKDNVFATQFHPEKSQEHGLAMLRAFLELKAA